MKEENESQRSVDPDERSLSCVRSSKLMKCKNEKQRTHQNMSNSNSTIRSHISNITNPFLFLNRCVSTGKAIPKDKAIKRFIVRNIVDASSLRDIKEASALTDYQLPKLYLKMYYCVEAAVHQRIVRGRSKVNRRIRTPPPRFGGKK